MWMSDSFQWNWLKEPKSLLKSHILSSSGNIIIRWILKVSWVNSLFGKGDFYTVICHGIKKEVETLSFGIFKTGWVRTTKTQSRQESSTGRRKSACSQTAFSALISAVPVFFPVVYLSEHTDSSQDKQKGLILTKQLSKRLGTTKKEEESNAIIFALYK